LSLLLVLVLASRGFSLGTPVFPSPQKPTFPYSNSIWTPHLFIYFILFTYIFISNSLVKRTQHQPTMLSTMFLYPTILYEWFMGIIQQGGKDGQPRWIQRCWTLSNWTVESVYPAPIALETKTITSVQSQQMQLRQWTNQNSRQKHAACAERGKKCT